MTYVRRKRFTRKPKDILALTLKNLLVDEGFFCSKRTYDNIRDRVETFKRSSGFKYTTRPWGTTMMSTRRVA